MSAETSHPSGWCAQKALSVGSRPSEPVVPRLTISFLGDRAAIFLPRLLESRSMSERVATTQWSQVLAARDGSDTEARAALESLCQTYWQPLYAYIRHQGSDPDEASDLTQGFFTELLERTSWPTLIPRRADSAPSCWPRCDTSFHTKENEPGRLSGVEVHKRFRWIPTSLRNATRASQSPAAHQRRSSSAVGH